MKSYVLDSFAMIAFFENEAGAEEVAEILRRLVRGRAKGSMSVINWGEMYYSVRREQGEDDAEKILSLFNRYPIQLVDADRALTYEAAKLKAAHKIAYSDCFAAALAIKMKAPLVTGDPEFEKLEGRVLVHWIGR